MNHTAKLEYLNACSDGMEFARKHKSMKAVWYNLHNPEWMVWLLGKLDYQDDRNYRLFACWCVRNTPLHDGRVVWDILTDQRSRNAVEVAERYAEGNATREELDAAWDAARSAQCDKIREMFPWSKVSRLFAKVGAK